MPSFCTFLGAAKVASEKQPGIDGDPAIWPSGQLKRAQAEYL
jgi:hypothetical protein